MCSWAAEGFRDGIGQFPLTWIWLTLQVDVLIVFLCKVCYLRCGTMGLTRPVVPFRNKKAVPRLVRKGDRKEAAD